MRRELSVKTRKAAYDRSGGICECGCGMPFGRESVEYDHRIPDYFAGMNDLDNCVAMRRSCHVAKTRDDAKDIAKTRRILSKQRGHEARKKKIPGSKGTGIRKKMDGTVVRVEE